MNFLKLSLQINAAAYLKSGFAALSAIVIFMSCSTVESGTGRCKAFKEPQYVASSRDTDGKEWKLTVTPNLADLKCDFEKGNNAPTGTLTFTAVITDGQGFAKPALAVNSRFVGSTASTGSSGFQLNPDGDDDVATDACGSAVFTVKWTCPGALKSAGGYFYVTSGPLSSSAVKITLEHTVQATPTPAAVQVPAPTPAP